MATLTPREITRAGIDLSTGGGGFVAASAGGDKFANTGREFVYFTNLSGGTITVTVDVQPDTIDGLAVANKTLAVLPATNAIMGPFPPGNYNDASGFTNLSYSGVASLTLQVFKLPVP